MLCRDWTCAAFTPEERDQATNLDKLIRLVEVRHLPGAQDVVDVFQEGLVYDLSVVEQEHCGLVVHACQTIQLLDVCGRDGSR